MEDALLAGMKKKFDEKKLFRDLSTGEKNGGEKGKTFRAFKERLFSVGACADRGWHLASDTKKMGEIMDTKENDFDEELKKLVDLYKEEFSDIIELSDARSSERSERVMYECVVTETGADGKQK